MSGPNNPITSVQTTLKIVEALKELEGAGVTDLAEQVGVSKGTIHNHLATLEHEDYIVKKDGEYNLGFRFLDVANTVKKRVKIGDLVQKEVDKLAEESGEMVLYTAEEHGLGVCLYRALGENAVQTPLYIGHRETLHHTAVGKSILAHLPEERVREIIDEHGLEQKTDNTITDPDELFNELKKVRKEGIAYNRGETIPGLIGVGAPITDQSGDTVFGISIIGPTSRLDSEEKIEELSEMLKRSVNIIEINATSL